VNGFARIGRAIELKNRIPLNAVVDGIDVVIVKVEDEVLAFENNCPHQHFSLLHQGNIEGCGITCPMHGWTFDMKSGDSTNGNGRLRILEVKRSDGWIWVENTKPDQTFSLLD
jgi:nitrite reductase/ring-hydroxylating ferredoxin subunit